MSDSSGAFLLALGNLPETVVTTLVGRANDSTVVTAVPPDCSVVIALSEAVPLVPIAVVAERVAPEVAGVSRVTQRAIQETPGFIEPDALRSLVQAPAVTFANLVSARPMLRGTDPGGTLTLLDGFPVLTPYHFARSLSSFVAEGVSDVTVQAGGMGLASGDAVAGIVDVHLADGSPDSTVGGAGLSLINWKGWVGGPAGHAGTWGAAGRVVWGGGLTPIPIILQEGHAALSVDNLAGFATRFTLYGSREAYHAIDEEDQARYHGAFRNALLGLRAHRFVGAARLNVAGSWSSSEQDVVDAGRHVPDNHFVTGGVESDVTMPLMSDVSVRLGGDLREWRIRNYPGYSARDTQFTSRRAGAYGGLIYASDLLTASVGERYDRQGPDDAWQLRAAARLSLAPQLVVSATAGRYTQFYHLLDDQTRDPDLLLHDHWLAAAEPGIGPQSATHYLADLNWALASGATIHLGAFSIQQQNVIEYYQYGVPHGAFRVVSDPNIHLRSGLGRSQGVEAAVRNLATASGRLRTSWSYLLSRSERDWGQGFVPWLFDRTHQVRSMGMWMMGRHWRFTWVWEIESSEPITELRGGVPIGGFDPFHGGTARGSEQGGNVFVGPENSTRGGPWQQHGDIAFEHRWGGNGHPEWAFGIAIINATLGAQSPVRITTDYTWFDSYSTSPRPRPYVYEPRLLIPLIPTFTLTVRF